MNKRLIFPILVTVLATVFVIASCSKDDDGAVDATQLRKDILVNTANNVCLAGYEDMYSKTQQLLTAVTTLSTTTTEANLNSSRQLWKDIRNTWEQSEAWLFGPVSADNIDPRIDTWPVDFNSLDSILATSNTLNEGYVDGLDDALKGFHPIEYLLWGQNGNKAAAAFTDREKQYLLALSTNLNTLSKEVRDSWKNSYTAKLATAGNGSTEYTSKVAAYTELVDAMAGICDEVANGKIKDPFDLQDPTQEESPFAKNSITDFTNNVQGVMDVYQGKFSADGKGLEDLVRSYNLNLDNELKTAHAAAIASLQAITVPFGQAILTQQTQVQNAMTKINALKDVLETKLSAFVLQYGE
jgi:putative iron-regulated protein